MHGSRWRGLETEQTWPRTLGWHNRPGNRRPRRPQALKPASHRASPRPYIPILKSQGVCLDQVRRVALVRGEALGR